MFLSDKDKIVHTLWNDRCADWDGVSTVAGMTKRTIQQFKTRWAFSLLCRIDIRKGLNALKREIPGGDTFMHLGLQRVSLSRDALSCYLTLRIKPSIAKSISNLIELSVKMCSCGCFPTIWPFKCPFIWRQTSRYTRRTLVSIK